MQLSTWTRSIIIAALPVFSVSACGWGETIKDKLTGADDDISVPDVSNTNPVEEDASFGPEVEGDVVAEVEVSRYVGKWYEIASIPQIFQRDCTATTATYAALDETTVSVVNECFVGSPEGQARRVEGTARIADPSETNAKLLVSFGFGEADYWVVELGVSNAGEPYPWAVVSNPDRSALWVLSRTPRMDETRLLAILQRLEARGFEPSRMSLTVQPTE